MNPTVLIVEDTITTSNSIAAAIKEEFSLEAVQAHTLSEAEKALESGTNFFAAIVDLSLPDCDEGKAVTLTTRRKIPTIVLTASHDRDLRDKILELDILEYLTKGGKVLERVLSSLHGIQNSKTTKVLVVDDSRVSQAVFKKMLELKNYQVLTAVNGIKALEVLQENKDIRLIITDYHMPEMDGVDLISKVRQRYSMDELAIIGVSSTGRRNLTAHFLRVGANDFLYKGCSMNEFHCRVRQNIDLVESFEEVREASIRDSLTQLYNRRYFFKSCAKLLEICKRGKPHFALAIMDIDFFKQVNDTYGHDAGDVVLRTIGGFLKKHSRKSDVVARYGGEEFVFYATNINRDSVNRFFDELRKAVAALPITHGNKTIHITMSMGVVTQPAANLARTLKEADRLLYQAKEQGRNQVVTDIT